MIHIYSFFHNFKSIFYTKFHNHKSYYKFNIFLTICIYFPTLNKKSNNFILHHPD